METFSREEVRAIDRRAVEELGLPAVVLMENAGRGAAEVILERLRALRPGGPLPLVGVLCGGGNNGGDGYVVARHLHNAGAPVAVFTTVAAERLRGEALVNRLVAERMGLAPAALSTAADRDAARGRLARAAVLVDGLLGTGFEGEVRPDLAPVLGLVAELGGREGVEIVALDVPSGLDCDTGRPAEGALRADHTVTFAAVKRGLVADSARPYVGELHLAGIGTPREWTERGGGDPRGRP